jgi:hypothetical protein
MPHMLLNTIQKPANTTMPGTTRRRPTTHTPRMGTPPTLDITPKRQLGRTLRSTARNSANGPGRRNGLITVAFSSGDGISREAGQSHEEGERCNAR